MLGISVDSKPVQAAFCADSGGVPYPVLADFHPKGTVAQAYGVWNDERGTSRRAVVVIDREGVVRHVHEYGPGSLPEPADILAEVKAL